jgi:enoyl-CoA hydratase/carnithine racemase
VSAAEAVADPAPEAAVIYQVTDSGVAVLTLNRPERLNTWGGDIAAAFYAGLDRAEADPAVRVIVLTGRGKAFCAGAQLGAMGSVSQSIAKTDQSKLASLVGEQQPFQLTTLYKPVVAAINGACVGIGFTQALMCDVRFAAAGAKFAASFARRGLIAEYGVSWILPRLTGWGVALDLLLSGRTFLADEAADLGLVKEVVPPEQLMKRAMEYAEDIAQNCSPASMAVIKRQAYGDAMREVTEASARAETLLHESLQRPDVIEGITSFLDKRAPSFPGLSAPTLETLATDDSRGSRKDDHGELGL